MVQLLLIILVNMLMEMRVVSVMVEMGVVKVVAAMIISAKMTVD